MKHWISSFCVMIAMGVSFPSTAGAAAAPYDTGVWAAQGVVGKYGGVCNNDGSTQLHGPGLGTLADGPKTASWHVNAAGGGTSAWHMTVFSLSLCGTMSPVQGIGAACHFHQGTGRGVFTYYSIKRPAWLKFSWPTAVGGTVPASGEASVDSWGSTGGKKPHEKSRLVMLLSFDGGESCLTKRDDGGGAKIGGAQSMSIVAAYEILPPAE